MTVTIKIHDVLHSADDFKSSDVEDQMLRSTDSRVEDIRIESGYQNSPVYIILSDNHKAISFDSVKTIARQVLKKFDRQVSDIDVDTTIRDRNLHIKP